MAIISNTYAPQMNEEGKYICLTNSDLLEATPEEKVRQEFIALLLNDYGYPVSHIRREVPIYHGSSQLQDSNGRPVRADIVVYRDKVAQASRDQGRIKFVVECKRSDAKNGYAQLVSYIFSTNSPGGVWTNGVSDESADTIIYRVNRKASDLRAVPTLPRVDEDWGSVTRRAKADLDHPNDVRRLFKLCNNKLYGRGMENYDYDLTMDMVRILVAKIQDESSIGHLPDFYITDDEYESAEGRTRAADRVRKLFRDFAENFPEVFPADEKIEVPDEAIAEVVGVLQPWSLIAAADDAEDWDVMGAAYEQYTHQNLKRQRGQFFTNRLIVGAMVRMANPKLGEKVLDPAGGSGGFATASYRHMRRQIIENTAPGSPQRERQLGDAKQSIFLSEISPRLVKLAKTAMLLNGDGHSGMTRANSLDSFQNLDPWIISRCGRNVPKVILTNPPFAGQGESRVSDPRILSGYTTARKFVVKNDIAEYTSEMQELQAPEILFFERCLEWLAPGGRMAIVLPKGFLDTTQYLPARQLLFEYATLEAVISLHKNSFQPDTGVRTCVVYIRKLAEGESAPDDYRIFMATSQKVGQDSEGVPIFRMSDDGTVSTDLDQDLDDIVSDYEAFLDDTLTPSQYRYEIRRHDIENRLNINPQFYSPHLNESIEQIRRFDDVDGWSVATLGQIEPGVAIFKGPRLKTENVLVDSRDEGAEVVGYFTPSAMLQDKRDSAKLIDLAKASKKQLKDFDVVTVHEGDLLLTRSGTIGRLAYVSSVMDGQLVSDDMIRVRVPSPALRAYVAGFLLSDNAAAQMARNEYGTIQQHLEPAHVRNLLIPVPDDWGSAVDLIADGDAFIRTKEASDRAIARLRDRGFDGGLEGLVGIAGK